MWAVAWSVRARLYHIECCNWHFRRAVNVTFNFKLLSVILSSLAVQAGLAFCNAMTASLLFSELFSEAIISLLTEKFILFQSLSHWLKCHCEWSRCGGAALVEAAPNNSVGNPWSRGEISSAIRLKFSWRENKTPGSYPVIAHPFDKIYRLL